MRELMPQPRRPLPARTRAIPWSDLRRHAATAFHYVRAGWASLSDSEREELTRLLRKSRGRPRNLTRDEARRLGYLASKSASAARRAPPPRG
jgi:hypothetical protein